MSHLRRSSQRDSLLIDGCIMMSHISVDHPNERRRRSFFFLYRITCSDGQLLVVCCLCELSKRNGFVSLGSLLALFRLFDYRARPEFCVCEPWGSLSLLLSPFHPRGCRATDNTRTKHSRYSTVCQSTKPFDCVSTLTDAVAPTF